MGKESHYSSKKDRIFVRAIQGQYSLKDELKRLRAMPRVIKGKWLPLNPITGTAPESGIPESLNDGKEDPKDDGTIFNPTVPNKP